MSKLIRVLVVEDSEADAYLMLRELGRAGFEPMAERVETPEEMNALLEDESWDVVLGDYAMPRFGGLAALKILRDRGLDIPFIIVSGVIGEEVAVETLKAGASDYVLKHNLTRLAPAIERELKAVQERRRRRQAEADVAHLAAIVESSEDAIISTNFSGIVTSWNRGAERIFGYAPAEMVGHPVANLVPRECPNEMPGIWDQLKRGERVPRFETRHLCKDGRRIDVSVAISPIKDSLGQVAGASIIARDVTELKRSEAERLQLIAELTETLAKVRALSGLLPMCASCKKIRNDDGYWEQVETFIRNHSSADFTHSICPQCADRLYPDLKLNLQAKPS
jgi:two-component system, cell cycle sensor histidine kinase and response regulator CckA